MTSKVWIPPNGVGFPPGVTDAAVRLWVEDFRQAMLEIGLVQTADTGQFDVATHTTVSAGTNNTTGGFDVECYMVFRFDDALQATAPVFFKVEIIKATGDVGNGYVPGSRVTVGTGTNGAGTITGPTAQIYSAWGENTAPQTGPTHQSWASYDGSKGFVGVCFAPGIYGAAVNISPAVHFFIERIPDIDGAPTDEGFSIWGTNHISTAAAGAETFGTYSFLPAITGYTVLTPSGTVYDSATHSIPYFRTLDSVTSDLFVVSAVHLTPYPVRANGLAMVRKSAVAKGTEFEVRVYGATDTNFVALDQLVGIRPTATNASGVPAFMFT